MLRSIIRFATASLSVCTLVFSSAAAESHTRSHDFVLGTNLDLIIVSETEAAADKVEASVMNEIERLNAILSTYDSESEISRLNSVSSASVSTDLFTVLSACEAYREQTKNALSCRIGGLLETWQSGENQGEVPSRAQLRLAAGEIRRAKLNMDESAFTLDRPDLIQFELNALAKGYIIDRAMAAARAADPDLEGLLINIGGDIKTWGQSPDGISWTAAIKAARSESGDGVTLKLGNGALATSGRGPRYRDIGGKSFSHIISPKNGWHVEGISQASVFAEDAMTADALATALLVMPLNDGLALIETLADIEARVVADDGRAYTSNGWALLESGSDAARTNSNWPNGYAFSVDFVIPELDVSNYERPYIAAWVADSKRQLVRILLLAGPEERWMEENYYWHRRFGRKAGSLPDALSEPTRKPGQYLIQWDGLDHDGNPAPAGEYVLHVEAAREHGDHQHESFEITLGSDPFAIERQAGNELGNISVSFGVAP
ncbi:MAG: DUF2271 domain-containing protein [Henriciella sp.]|nr:DUF2271 domain-containing protein [Henriciella sp.]